MARITAEAAVKNWRDLKGALPRLIDGIDDEFGPLLRTRTGSNAVALAFVALIGWSPAGDWARSNLDAMSYMVAGAAIVWHLLRTLNGRKNATGPIISKRDAGQWGGYARGPGSEAEQEFNLAQRVAGPATSPPTLDTFAPSEALRGVKEL
jgi:hypothetical protein